MKTRKNKLTNLLKIGFLLFGISLLLFNCGKDDILEEIATKKEYSISAETVSFEEAHKFFNTSYVKRIQAKGINNNPLEISPNWKGIKQQSIDYTDAKLTYVDAAINKEGTFTSELFFIKIDGEMKNIIYTLYRDSIAANGTILKGRVFFNQVNGDFIDGYTIKEGKFNTRFVFIKNEKQQRNSKKQFVRQTAPPIGGGEDSGNGGNCWNTANLPRNGRLNTVFLGTFSSSSSRSSSSNRSSYSGYYSLRSFNNYNYSGSSTIRSSDERGGGGGRGGYTSTSSRSRVVSLYMRSLPSWRAKYGKDCLSGYKEDSNGNCIRIKKKTVKTFIIINNLKGKAKCVYNKMVDNKNNINWILENFKDGDKPSQFNLKFQMSTTLGSLTNASTATPKQSGIPNTFVISINQNRAKNINTTLTVARTIIHEGIHARLWEFMYSRDKNLAIISNDFPGIYEYYKNHQQNWDHEQMAAYYRGTIAKGLKQFDNGQHSDGFYNALAWEGLSKIKDANNNHELIYTKAWKKLTLAEQTAILQIITNEKASGNKGCL